MCAATQLRGSIHERGTIANIDVNEAATNETIRVAAIHKKNNTFVTDGTDVTIPPRIIVPKNGSTGREGGYRFPSSLTPFCLLRRRMKAAAMTVKDATNTGTSPPSNIYEEEA